jgi:hypothetical protein
VADATHGDDLHFVSGQNLISLCESTDIGVFGWSVGERDAKYQQDIAESHPGIIT